MEMPETEHLASRSCADRVNPYHDAIDALDHLKLGYQDVNRAEVAKYRFCSTVISPGQGSARCFPNSPSI